MNYAVIQTGGKQYKVAEGDTIAVEKLAIEDGKDINFDVLFHAAGDTFSVGTPVLTNMVVIGQVVSQFKAPKIRVAKFKAKARYRKVYGHRQQLTQVKIIKIAAGKAKAAKTESKEAVE
ncbi:MAG: 50S ribosomal protein L21 [Patescibacteria group bacterium]